MERKLYICQQVFFRPWFLLQINLSSFLQEGLVSCLCPAGSAPPRGWGEAQGAWPTSDTGPGQPSLGRRPWVWRGWGCQGLGCGSSRRPSAAGSRRLPQRGGRRCPPRGWISNPSPGTGTFPRLPHWTQKWHCPRRWVCGPRETVVMERGPCPSRRAVGGSGPAWRCAPAALSPACAALLTAVVQGGSRSCRARGRGQEERPALLSGSPPCRGPGCSGGRKRRPEPGSRPPWTTPGPVAEGTGAWPLGWATSHSRDPPDGAVGIR